jgi:hypothetical protein
MRFVTHHPRYHHPVWDSPSSPQKRPVINNLEVPDYHSCALCPVLKRELPKQYQINKSLRVSSVSDGIAKSVKNNVAMKTDSNATFNPRLTFDKCSSWGKTPLDT